MKPIAVLGSVATVVVGVLYYYDMLFTIISLVIHASFALMGIYLGASWSLLRGPSYKPPALPPEVNIASIVLQKMMEKIEQRKPEEKKKVVISRNLDLSIQDVMNLFLRDYVHSWYQTLCPKPEYFISIVRQDIWVMIETLSQRLSKIDLVKFITADVVSKLEKHFRQIRLASKRQKDSTSEYDQTFALHHWLENEETEIEFLRQVSETLLIVLLPRPYARCKIIRHFLREIFASSVFKPSIDMICDPDYINQNLISYIDYRQRLSEDTRKTYTYAATYESFVKMIEKCGDIEHLKQIRYSIITEIMQATTINNLKKARGIQSGKESSPRSTGKGELLKARNLPRYINQLTVAKSRCEKRIHSLGGPDYKYYTEDCDEDARKVTMLPGQKVLGFGVIMDSPGARGHFMKFLKRDDNESLLGFWNAVEKLKFIDKRQRHQLVSEIYQQYISSSSSIVKLDRGTIKGMESFMLGNGGPESFNEGQIQVQQILEEQFYPSFLVSEIYHRYVSRLEEDYGDLDGLKSKDELFFEPKDMGDSDEEDGFMMLASQSYHAQQKLQQLDDKIQNKLHAIKALKISQKSDGKMKKVGEEMEKELDNFRGERRQLESHILRTQQWCENQGWWRAHVYDTEIVEEGDKKSAVFVLVVHLSGSGMGHSLQNSTQGWVVSRTIQDFKNVHEKLIQIGPWLRKKDLPSIGRFTSVDKSFVEDAKKTLDEYLTAVMKDERMAHSEALYGFLSPTPEYLQQPVPAKKSKFFFSNLLKSLPTIGPDSSVSEESDLLFGGDDSSKDDRNKDSIAEPLYCLINEVFELRGMFKWLRKTFIVFVEVTFGRSINRQLRETVEWIFSESMLIYYIRTFQESMWPDGQQAESLPARSEEEKMKTRLEAKDKFLQSLPDATKTLMGEDNSRRGAIKMFEVLQDVRLNKHLFYVLLELLLFELCPELRQVKEKQKRSEEEMLQE